MLTYTFDDCKYPVLASINTQSLPVIGKTLQSRINDKFELILIKKNKLPSLNVINTILYARQSNFSSMPIKMLSHSHSYGATFLLA